MAALDFPSSPSVGQVYTANGRSYQWDGTTWGGITQPTLVAPGLILLEQYTASSSAQLDFTSISATYDEYMFEFLNVHPATDNVSFSMRMGTGGGPTYDTGGNYNSSAQVSNQTGGSAIVAGAAASSIELAANVGNASTAAVSGSLKLFAPADATFFKNVVLQTWYKQNTGNFTARNGGGNYAIATAVTAIRFFMSSGNIASGIIRMYGFAK